MRLGWGWRVTAKQKPSDRIVEIMRDITPTLSWIDRQSNIKAFQFAVMMYLDEQAEKEGA